MGELMSRGVKRHKPELTGDVGTLVDEIGLDDKQIPGGIPHQLNHPVAPHMPLDPGPYKDQFRGVLAGGVPHVPATSKPKEDQFETAHKMATVNPQLSPERQQMYMPPRPTPVYVVDRPSGTRAMSRMSAYQLQINAAVSEQALVRDKHRTHATIINETTGSSVRIGYTSIGAQSGFLIPGLTSSPRFESQDAVWVYNPGTVAVYVSVLSEYGVTAGD
jgi:hypothetical protein